MKALKALIVLADLSAAQWGLFTTAQAAQHGVSRLVLSRLAETGHIERVRHGVYRDAGAAVDEHEPVRAAWLATEPGRPASDRLAAPEVVVSGISAARLHDAGDLRDERFEFTSLVRRQSQQPDLRLRQRAFGADEITIRHGLPVTTIERTITDLVEAQTDLSHVATVLADALRVGGVERKELARRLAPLAERRGFPKGEGAAVVEHLLHLEGLDAMSTAHRVVADNVLVGPVMAELLRRLGRDAAVVDSLVEARFDASILEALTSLAPKPPSHGA